MQTGILLMTYGSPRDLDDVEAYITRVRGGRVPGPDMLAEFRRRYEVIGMSPLIEITRNQAAALERELGSEFRAAAGMRFSEPSVGAAAEDLRARGAERILGLILSPQYSPILMAGYARALEAAADALPVRCVQAWHLNPAFIDVLASRIRAALARFPDEKRDQVPVLLTAHSLPKRVVVREPEYVEQLLGTRYEDEQIFSTLDALGFTPAPGADGTLRVTVPGWRRFDVEGRADIAEEVGRIIGGLRLSLETGKGPRR